MRKTERQRHEQEKGNPKKRRADFLKSLCFLASSLLGVGVFFILPFGVVVYYSMIDGVASRNFVFLDNFKLFQNSAFRMASINTLKIFRRCPCPLRWCSHCCWLCFWMRRYL